MDKIFRNWKNKAIVYGFGFFFFWIAFYFMSLPGDWAWSVFVMMLLHKAFLKNVV